MKLNVSYSEISEYIETHYRQKIDFIPISEKVLEVIYRKKVAFFSVKVKIELGILDVRPSSVILSFSGKKAVKLVVSSVLKYLKDRNPEIGNAILIGDNDLIAIELNKIKKAQDFTNAIALKRISIGKDDISILAALKN